MTNRFPTVESTGAIRRWWAPAIALAVLAALFPAPPADAAARKAGSAPRKPPRRRPRARPASRSWRSCSIKSQKVTILRRRRLDSARAGVDRAEGTRNAGRRLQPWWRRTGTTVPTSMTMPGCRTCCASPGTASRCMAARCPDIRPRRVVSGCRSALRKSCSTRCSIDTRVIISPNDAEPVAFSHPALFVPNPKALAAAPARAEKLAREADEAAQMAKQAKSAVATCEARDGVAHGVAAQAGTG